MLNLSSSFETAESVEICPHRAKLIDACTLFKRFFDEKGIKTDIGITSETVKNYPVLYIKPADPHGFEELAQAFDQHADCKGTLYNTVLRDVAVAVDDGEHPVGFLMMAGMMVVQDIARAITLPQQDPLAAKLPAGSGHTAMLR